MGMGSNALMLIFVGVFRTNIVILIFFAPGSAPPHCSAFQKLVSPPLAHIHTDSSLSTLSPILSYTDRN
jgi:hypothetical protein